MALPLVARSVPSGSFPSERGKSLGLCRQAPSPASGGRLGWGHAVHLQDFPLPLLRFKCSLAPRKQGEGI